MNDRKRVREPEPGLELLLHFHITFKQVRVKRNTTSRLLQASDTAKALGVFRARDFVAAGYSREYLRRLVGRRQVRQLRRGLYASAAFDGDHNQSLVEAAKKVPRGVVCLISTYNSTRSARNRPTRSGWRSLGAPISHVPGNCRFGSASSRNPPTPSGCRSTKWPAVRCASSPRRRPSRIASSIEISTASTWPWKPCARVGGRRDSP
ncbi:MAG: type IV toxin-antitoxin system AbiEi family antitoxin domain-containing protein [Opitutaceae bacterium]|nr:type IV toxin-antitoxin system AbiEi family antitoxin domain-containing protein [Opitutaceae bacterium]